MNVKIKTCIHKRTLRSTELEKVVAAELVNKPPPFYGTDSFM